MSRSRHRSPRPCDHSPCAEYVRHYHNAPFRRENRAFCRRIERHGLEAADAPYPVATSAQANWQWDCW